MSSYETERKRAEEEAYQKEVRRGGGAEGRREEGEVKDLVPETPIESIEGMEETVEDTSEAIEETVYGDPMSFARSMIGEGRSVMLGGFTCALTEMAPGALLTAEVIGACNKSRENKIEDVRGEITEIEDGN